jgi:hypothetical protein
MISISRSSFATIIISLLAFQSADAFTVMPQQGIATVAPSSTRLELFGGLKDAFKNDDKLGTAENAGLKNGPKYNDQVSDCIRQHHCPLRFAPL